jgi:putative component of membrane protein insertase Oxa1/YidC/SpoIIIJ protein YidD
MTSIHFILVSVFLAGTALAAEPITLPEKQLNPAPVVTAPIRFFQKYVSGADGHRCPMTPSCSSYTLKAIQRHGAIKGWIMACDRLMRCGRDELKLGPPVITPNGWRHSDPVRNNDFWWH